MKKSLIDQGISDVPASKTRLVLHDKIGYFRSFALFVKFLSRKANCWDNAPQECFFGHLKEEINVKGCTYEDICAIIDNWMDYYNKDHYKDHYQWDLQKLSPNEYYEWLIKGIWSIVDSAPVPRSLAFLFSKVIASLKRKTKAVNPRRIPLRKTRELLRLHSCVALP